MMLCGEIHYPWTDEMRQSQEQVALVLVDRGAGIFDVERLGVADRLSEIIFDLGLMPGVLSKSSYEDSNGELFLRGCLVKW